MELLLVSQEPLAFGRWNPQTERPDPERGFVNDELLGPWVLFDDELDDPNQFPGVAIYRNTDGVKGYLVNVGGEPLAVRYIGRDRDNGEVETIGPTADYIQPGQFKEVGAAPNRIVWVVVPWWAADVDAWLNPPDVGEPAPDVGDVATDEAGG